MNNIKIFLSLTLCLFISFLSYSQSIEDRDIKEIKSKSRLIVKEFEELLNFISNSQAFDSEIDEIVNNSFDPNNSNRLFKDSKIIVEDDLNPELTDRERNIELRTYLNNFKLQYNKTNGSSVSFEDIVLSELYKRDNYFIIVNFTRNFSSTFSSKKLSYTPLNWNLELEISKNNSGKWYASIAGFSYSYKPDFIALKPFLVDISKSSNSTVSLASDIEEAQTPSSETSITQENSGYDEYYYSLLSAGEKAFTEERFDDAFVSFEQAKTIKKYDSYVTLMSSRSKRLQEVQLLESKDRLEKLFSTQALNAEKRGDIDIALKRYKSLLNIKNDKATKEKVDYLEKRINAKDDVTFFLSLEPNESLLKDFDKKSKGKNKNIEYDLGKALLIQNVYTKLNKVKEIKSALDPLDGILKKDPDFTRARLARAKISTQLADYKSALSDLTYLIEKNPSDYAFYIERGKVYLLTNAVDLAVADFTRANEINQIAPAGHFELGKIYFSKNNFKDAEYHFKQCISAQYGNPTYHYFYALSIKDSDTFKSLEHLKISRELDLNQTLERQIEKELSDFGFRAESFINQGELELAEKILNKVLDVNSNSISGLVYYSILLKTKKVYSEAIPILERLRTLNPNNQKIKFELADNYAKAGRFDQSLSLYNEMINSVQEAKKRYTKNSSDSNVGIAFDKELLKVYVGLGNLFFDNGKYNESIESFLKAKDIPNHKEENFIIRLAEAYLNVGSIKEAFATIAYGIKLNPKNAGYPYLRGYIYFKEKDFKNAVINFNQSSLDLEYKDNSNYYLGLISYIDLNYEQAYKHFKLVKNYGQNFENALEYALLISTKLGLYSESYGFFEQLSSLYKDKPTNVRYQTTLLAQKSLSLKKGENNLIEDLESNGLNLLKEEPNNPRLLYSIALLNLKKENNSVALNYLDRALRTKQLYEADLYIDKLFQEVDDRKIRKLIKNYF